MKIISVLEHFTLLIKFISRSSYLPPIKKEWECLILEEENGRGGTENLYSNGHKESQCGTRGKTITKTIVR